MERNSAKLILKNKAAIVAGGSRGIGRAIAALFMEKGAKVAITSRTAEEVKKTTKELKEKAGDVIGIVADVSDWQDVKRVVRETLIAFKTIDILVNCAAVQKPIGPFLDVDIEQWTRNICIDLFGTVMCCKAVLPVMTRNRKGKIINFSGGGATSPRPNFSAYAAAKTAVVRFTETLAMELEEYGINVNAIAPGAVKTRLIKEIIESGEKAGRKGLAEAIKVNQEGGSPPECAAELALFLACEDSDNISGRLISAVWDDWKNFNKNIDKISGSSLYTLRRIDGRNFMEKKS